MKYYVMAFKNFFQFKGRANRSEYWYFVLFNIIFAVAAIVADNVLSLTFAESPYGIIYSLYALAALIPGLAVTVRRLHDVDKSGWYILISLIPIVGSIILLVALIKEGTRGENQYGPDPNGDVTFDFETSQATN